MLQVNKIKSQSVTSEKKMAPLSAVGDLVSAWVLKLAHPWAKTGIIIFWLVITCWLAYSRIWQPLQEDIVVPGDTPPDNLSTNSAVITAVEQQFKDRISHNPRTFRQFEALFTLPTPISLPPATTNLPPPF